MAVENASLTTIEEIRDQYQFIVPEYQRGFAWSESQWNDLWLDAVMAGRRQGSEHFAGSLMLRSVAQNNRTEIVDGQQRLTSISLLLRALGHPSFNIEFQSNEPLQTYFDHFARGKAGMGARLGEYRSFYARNIQDAAQFFSAKVGALPSEQRADVAAAVLKRFKLFVLRMAPAFDVHVAFETINNRGKPLSVLEKLKNRLIYLCSKASDQAEGKDAAEHVHAAWKGVYHWLGKGEKLLGDDEFLRAHAMGWFRKEHKAEWLTTQLFDEEFSANNDEVVAADVREYVDSLEQVAAWWYFLNHPAGLPGDACQALEALERTTFTSAKPLLLWSLFRCATVDKQLLSNPKRQTDWIRPFTALVRQTERFSVLVLLGNNRLSNTGQSDFWRSAFSLAHPGAPLGPRAATPPAEDWQAAEYAVGHMKALTDNWSYDDPEGKVLDQRFQFSGYFDPATFVTVIADRLRKGDGFYNWAFGKLVIYEWERHLRGDRGLPEKKAWEAMSWDDSVEHIYPQSLVEGWWDMISVDGRSEALRRSIFNSMGNLLLLSGSRNSSLSNNLYWDADESNKCKQRRFSGGSYSEWQVAQVCANRWTVSSIAARGIAMMRHAQRVWGFRLVDEAAPLTDWLPVLFGDAADKIRSGAASHDTAVDGRSLKSLVQQFEATRPG